MIKTYMLKLSEEEIKALFNMLDVVFDKERFETFEKAFPKTSLDKTILPCKKIYSRLLNIKYKK